MVGFKSIFLLLSLLIFGACVPQTKQTECGSNEAFNASLRTCVPVMNGPSSFINISSFSPTSTLTKYKNDTTPITLSITVSNPYAQTYTITWERVFNGVPVTLTPTTPTTYSFAPTLLATEVGTHIISAKIKDANNQVVDTHSFEIKINDLPKPIINTATVSPALYHSTYTPLTVPQDFSFTVKNNGATMTGAGYRTDWKLYRSGTLIDSETDMFPTVSPVGSLSTNGLNYPVYTFDPILIDGIAVGSYTLLARVTNNAAEVVAEQQWTMTVAHPALSKVTNRDIYSSTSSPAFTAITTAYNNVAYTSSTTYNFIPAGGTLQGDYCVTVVSGEGTYVSDSQFVRVDYYLDGATLIYSGLTSAVDSKVCLTDAAAATLNSVIFSNSTSTTAQSHTLVARVVDEATGQEYSSADMNPSLGSYPITWNFNVKPQNAAPTVAFGTMTGLTCSTNTSTVKSGCTVASDTNFTVRISLTSDDFYTLPADEANFDYSLVLYRNGVAIQTCTKSDPGYTAATDTNGADSYECVFNIESYNSAGPINLSAQTYQIKGEILDNGSPITGTGMTSSSLTWSFSSVTETNTAPTIPVWSVADAVEGSAIVFTADITDAQRDNHTWAIKYCTNPTCTTSSTLTSGTITRTTDTNPYTLSVSYTLPEDFLLGLTGLGCDAIERGQDCNVDFFITVTDVPNSVTPLSTNSSLDTSAITNYNPAPVLNTAFSNPAPSTFNATTTFAFVGHPLSISNTPSSILSDASAVAAEENFRYQWYIKNNTSVTAWTAIEGATTNNLIWTPSLMQDVSMPTDNPVSLMLCVEDHPTSVLTSAFETTNPNTALHVCSNATPWVLTVLNNVAVAHDISTSTSGVDLATSSSENGNETAVWYETPDTFNAVTSSAAYIAMIDNNNMIHVKKVLVKDRGGIDTINASQIVSFYPVASGTVSDVRDLSITGTSTNSELYIAYMASRTGSPGSYYPQVRRIDLTSTTGKSVPNNHAGKFGFDYDGLGYTNNCSPSADCTGSAASGVTSITFSPSGGSITGNIVLVTPAGNFSVNFGTYNAVNTICSTCSGTTMAQNLADIINQSTDYRLAGYSATQAGSTITINGARANDYFDAYLEASPHIADRMGKIYIAGGSWYLPFIDSSLGGSYTDKISVYTAPTGSIMSSVAEALLEPGSTAGLASMDAATKIDNWYDGTNLWIAMVSQTGSAGKLYNVNATSFALNDSDNIFSGTALLDVQVAASSSTTNVFVLATAAVGSELMLGVYTNNGTLVDEFDMDDPSNVDSLTDDYFNTGDIASLRIVPYGNEARLFAVSKGTTVSDYKLYGARLSLVSSVWTLSCGDCAPISEQVQDVGPHVSIGVAPIRFESGADYRLASDGFVTNQGIKDVAFVSFGRLDSALPTICDPAIGVFNVEGENIGSTTLFDGTTAAPVAPADAGLYRPPFFKN